MKLARHHSNPYHIQVLILAWLCLVVLATKTGWFSIALNNKSGELKPNCVSLMKIIAKLFPLLNHMLLFAATPDFATLMNRMARQINYHDTYEKRQIRENLPALAAEFLS